MRVPIIWVIFFVFNSYGADFSDLKNGDVILQSRDCYYCALFEEQQQAPYSHLGIIIRDSRDQVLVLEALSKVTLTPLEQFMKTSTPGSAFVVVRHKSSDLIFDFEWSSIARDFLGTLYDAKFVWEEDFMIGDPLYCSELVYRYYETLGLEVHDPRPMTFDRSVNKWKKYFSPGPVPIGHLGIEPVSFLKSKYFKFVIKFYATQL